jgi:predicted metal-dependent enzyme (double-stranded beta helix superfamily)
MLFQKEIVDIISKKLDEIRDIEEIKMLLKVIDNKIDNYNC